MKPKRPEIKPYLLKWINTHEGIHKKVDLYIVGDEIDHSAEGVGRALRELAEEKKIFVSYYDGKYVNGLAQYSALPITQKKLPTYTLTVREDGTRVAIMN